MTKQERKDIIDNILNNGMEKKYFPFGLTDKEMEYVTSVKD